MAGRGLSCGVDFCDFGAWRTRAALLQIDLNCKNVQTRPNIIIIIVCLLSAKNQQKSNRRVHGNPRCGM
jgi:hypothetical protein